jgi:hypothetical protein
MYPVPDRLNFSLYQPLSILTVFLAPKPPLVGLWAFFCGMWKPNPLLI